MLACKHHSIPWTFCGHTCLQLSEEEFPTSGAAAGGLVNVVDHCRGVQYAGRVDNQSPCPLTVKKHLKLDAVCRLPVSESILQMQDDCEVGASNRFHERGCAQVAILGRVFGEWHAIDADLDRSTGETVGVHGGSGAVRVYVVRFGVVACGVLVGEVEVLSEEARQAGAFEQREEGAQSGSHMQATSLAETRIHLLQYETAYFHIAELSSLRKCETRLPILSST